MFAALWFKWRPPVSFWRFGECVGMLRLGRGLLEREIAVGWIFYQKRG